MNTTPVIYKPYNERTPDNQYELLLKEILENGKSKVPIHNRLSENKDAKSNYTLELSGKMLHYKVTNGAPITPIRDLRMFNMWKGAIGEIIGFINGARTITELKEYGCSEGFWRGWVTEKKCADFGLEKGDLGPGSYGPTLTALPLADGSTFNQVSALIKQMIRKPYLRTHALTTWYPPLALGDEEQQSPRKVVVAPCHGNFVQFNVFEKDMDMIVYQRSADAPVGLVLNLTEWFAFGIMVAYITNLQFKEYTHYLPNPQIYDVQIPSVEELLTREPRRLPSLYLFPKREIKTIFDFRVEDFALEYYDAHPGMKIQTLI